MDGMLNIDIRPEVNPDLACDLNQGIPFKNESIKFIRAHDVIEHLFPLRIINFFEEAYRVLIPNGELNILVPLAGSGNGAFCDPTHLSFFNRASFRYYTEDAYRNLYNIKAKFEKTYYKEFNSDPEWGIIHIHINLVKIELPKGEIYK